MSTVVKPNTAVLTKEQVRRGLETHEITPNYLKHGFTRFNLAAIGTDSESINDISILSSYKNLQDLNLSNA